MAFLFDIRLSALPVSNEQWEEVIVTPGNSVKAFSAMLNNAAVYEGNVSGPWLMQYSSKGTLGEAFADAAAIVASAIDGDYTGASIEDTEEGDWVPLPDGRHLLHVRALDGMLDSIVRTVSFETYTLSYELLVEAAALELVESVTKKSQKKTSRGKARNRAKPKGGKRRKA